MLIFLVQRNECQDQQLQMPEDLAALMDPTPSVADLQKNITALWTYIYELRGAVTHYLNELKQKQEGMERAIYAIEHLGSRNTNAAHTAEHSHSGESSHSHGSDHHSHSGEHHHHSGEYHSHSDEQHSHGDGGHSHGGDDHSHGNDGHSHDSDGHSHGNDGHSHGDGSHNNYRDDHSHSHSHSHTDDDHSSHSGHGGHDNHHGHDHHDSHENVDDLQQTAQVDGPLVDPVIVPNRVNTGSHNAHHPGSWRSSQTSEGSRSSVFKPLNITDSSHHHHHHHSHNATSNSRTRNKTVAMPKYSEYDLYEFAVCDVKPNRVLSEEQKQNVVGQVSFWQKKAGGPLNIHVRVSGFEMGDHHAHHQQQQEEDNETPTPGGHKHGFHIHATGDLSNGCQSAGPHYNPKNMNHGGPNDLVRHVGDLGNIECDDHGNANVVFSDDFASLKGQYSIVGKALVIHAKEDDLGRGNDEETLKTGNSGARLACCVVQKVKMLPFTMYRAMKTAVQYQNR